jgi:radical SAM superfamily enzyme YgiQ (UPF0313 family)
MKIALVWPKSTFLSDPLQWPPLGLFYLSSRLESLGHQTEFFDLTFDPLPEDGEYDHLWLSATLPQMKEIRRIAETTKDWQTKTVLGGAASWDSPQACRGLGFDVVVGGEADNPDNVAHLLAEIANHDGYEKYIRLPVSRSLDWVLPPNRRWTTNYHSYMTDEFGNRYRMASLFVSRGCPMSCAFCSSGRLGEIWDKFTRYEPLESVRSQIETCRGLGFTGLAYYDDILPLNKKRTLEILKLHREYDMKFRCFLRSDIINNQGGYDYLAQMKDGGLIEFFVGVESASNEIKANIHKGTTIEQDRNIYDWAVQLKILPKFSFIIGLPGETLETMQATREWILQLDPRQCRVQVDRLIPFLGTPITKNPEQYDLTWETRVDDDYFYKGRADLSTHSFVRTSHLTVEQIDDFWRMLTEELNDLGFRS